MAEVTLTVGGYSYQVACRDGEEAHLERLGALVDAKAGEARAAVGTANEVRQLLLSALLFADEAIDRNKGMPAPVATPGLDPAILEALADRIETIAARLEKPATTA
jgi:cell division protein ZapA